MHAALRRWEGWLFVVALASLVGCGKEPPPAENVAEHFGRLPGLRQSPLEPLQDELARVVDEGGTPEQLAAVEVDPEDNVAAALESLFPPNQIADLLDRSRRLFPEAGFVFDAQRLGLAVAFRTVHEPQRAAAREALRRPHCRLSLAHLEGPAASLAIIDVFRIVGRLEAFLAAEALAEGDADAAAESLAVMFRLATHLGAERHLVSRLQAGQLRAEAFALLGALAVEEQVTPQRMTRLANVVDDQLGQWPSDAEATIGDRAEGLFLYELVRAGHAADLLTDRERERLGAAGLLTDLATFTRERVDADQLFYLRAMRRIVDASARPFYQRRRVFAEIRDELAGTETTTEYPLVAGEMLLADLERAHGLLAADRALCEAWALALARARGAEAPPYRVNPLTGAAYEVLERAGWVSVAHVHPGDDPEQPAVRARLVPPP